MVRSVEMCTQGLVQVRLGDITKMFHHPIFEFSFSLTHIEFTAVSTFDAVNEIAAMVSYIFATLRFQSSGGRDNVTTGVESWAISTGGIIAFM